MKICVDCYNLVKGKGKSIGIYNLTLSILNKLVKENNSNSSIYVLGNKYNKNDFSIPEVTFIEIADDPYSYFNLLRWENYKINKYLKKYKIDSVLLPRGYLPLRKLKHCNYVITIHDMIPFYYHENVKKEFSIKSIYIRFKLKYSARKADKIITISEFSKNEIIRVAKIVDSKINVIYNSLNLVEYEDIDVEPYICAITSKLEHKNAVGILKSYDKYCKIVEHPLPLKIIGITNTDDYFALDSVVKNNVTCYGYVSSNFEHYSLIHNSKLFLFLSKIEGFGFPPIEAMQCKVPVICSSSGSLSEVVRDGAVLVRYDDYDTIAKKMDYIINNYAEANDLISRGEKVVEFYCNINQGRKYLDVLKTKN